MTHELDPIVFAIEGRLNETTCRRSQLEHDIESYTERVAELRRKLEHAKVEEVALKTHLNKVKREMND